MVATHSKIFSPRGPALQLHGGSTVMSASSFWILSFRASERTKNERQKTREEKVEATTRRHAVPRERGSGGEEGERDRRENQKTHKNVDGRDVLFFSFPRCECRLSFPSLPRTLASPPQQAARSRIVLHPN
jgi:hypothetical protein